MNDARTGKSFGVLGTGKGDGTAWATANYGVGTKLGVTKNILNTATPPACYPHYMVFLAAPSTPSTTMSAIKVQFGAYDWVANTDLTKPVTPTLAADPKNPVTQSAMQLYASVMLCLGIITIY